MASVSIETYQAEDGRPLVVLRVDGYLFMLEAPSNEQARVIAWNVLRSLGLLGAVSLEYVDG